MKAIEVFNDFDFKKLDGTPFKKRIIGKYQDEDFFEHMGFNDVEELDIIGLSKLISVVTLYSYLDIDTEMGLFVYCYGDRAMCFGARTGTSMDFQWKSKDDYVELASVIESYRTPTVPYLDIIKDEELPPFFQVAYTTSITEEMADRAYYNGQLCEIVDLLNDETTITIRQFGNIVNIDISDMYFGYL